MLGIYKKTFDEYGTASGRKLEIGILIGESLLFADRINTQKWTEDEKIIQFIYLHAIQLILRL